MDYIMIFVFRSYLKNDILRRKHLCVLKIKNVKREIARDQSCCFYYSRTWLLITWISKNSKETASKYYVIKEYNGVWRKIRQCFRISRSVTLKIGIIYYSYRDISRICPYFSCTSYLFKVNRIYSILSPLVF